LTHSLYRQDPSAFYRGHETRLVFIYPGR
jgi:hypothetical protein